QVLQDVVLRVDLAFEAFFRRIREGQTPGYPRFHGKDRYNSFTYPQVGDHGGARLDNGLLVLSKIGRIALRWHARWRAPPRLLRSALRPMGGTWPSPVPRCPRSHSRPPARIPASTWGWNPSPP